MAFSIMIDYYDVGQYYRALAAQWQYLLRWRAAPAYIRAKPQWRVLLLADGHQDDALRHYRNITAVKH